MGNKEILHQKSKAVDTFQNNSSGAIRMSIMSDQQMGQYVARRAFQLRVLIEGHFLQHGISCNVRVIDGDFGDNDWLFTPGFAFHTDSGEFYLTVRGHISRLQSHNPQDIARWIEDDVGLETKMSNKDDIIAYERGTSHEIITKVLELCDSAALPNYSFP
jgi:hypothetical protein